MGKYTVKGKKLYWFPQRSYVYESNQTGETPEQWKKRVSSEWSLSELRKKSVNIKSCLYIFHERDKDEDGMEKPLHVHGVIEMNEHSGITQEDAKRFFGCSSDDNCQTLTSRKDLVNAYRYLTHISTSAINKKKERYLASDVHIGVDDDVVDEYKNRSRGLEEFYYDCCTKKNEREADNKAERQQTALQKYQLAVSRGQITADQAYDYIEEDVADEGFTITDALKAENSLNAAETRFYKRLQRYCCKNPWCKTNIYVFGEGDKGKSTFCRYFAESHSNSRGYHLVAAKGRDTTFDFADGYKGHIVSIANEVDGHFFKIEQFCDVLDPKYAANANSRNSDKFYAPNYVLLNNSKPLEQFIYDLCFPLISSTTSYHVNYLSCNDPLEIDKIVMCAPASDRDKICQVRRRFAIYVTIQGGIFSVYYRVNDKNPARFYNYCSYDYDCVPFVCFDNIPYNPNDVKCLDMCVELVDKAIAEYYTVNAFSVNPLNSGWSSLSADNPFGDAVVLPNADDGIISVQQKKMILYKQQEYEIEEFNNMIRRAVDFIDKTSDYIIANDLNLYNVSVAELAVTFARNQKFFKLDDCFRSMWLLQFYKEINNLFYNSRIMSYMFPDIKYAFMSARAKLIGSNKWITSTKYNKK